LGLLLILLGGMMKTYIIVGENEKIKFSRTADKHHIKGFVFTPISRCVALFAVNKFNDFLVAHLDPFTDLFSIAGLLKNEEIREAKIIFNPAKVDAQRLEEIKNIYQHLLPQIKLEEIILNDPEKDMIKLGVAALINFDGAVCDKDVNITDTALQVGLNEFKIFPEYFAFTELNSILEGLNSVSCHRKKTTKPLREVGEMAAPSGNRIYDFFARGDKKFSLIIEYYLGHRIKDVMSGIEKLETVNMLAMGMKLKEMHNGDHFKSWIPLFTKTQGCKENAAEVPSSSPRAAFDENIILSASAGSYAPAPSP
jgi:hypothetical protein